jgi:hypothetical protein
MRAAFSPSDYFHWVLDRAIRRDGGAGNIGQLRVRLRAPLANSDALCAAWKRLGEQAWTIGADIGRTWRGPQWRVRGPFRPKLHHGKTVDGLADRHLSVRLDGGQTGLIRLGYASSERDPGIVLTWNHQLLDARGAMALLAALPGLADGRHLREKWWEPSYRACDEVPRDPAARGRLARAAIPLLREHGESPWLRASPARNEPLPLDIHHRTFTPSDTQRCDARQRAACGRFAETPFLMAAVAAALEQALGRRAQAMFPLAVDSRGANATRWLANCHSYLMLSVPPGKATDDLACAARALKDAHKTWIANDGSAKLMSSLSWFPYLGFSLSRAQLGMNRAGIAGSCLFANTGKTQVPEQLFGREVIGVDHAATVPGAPGLAVLFRRDRRGFGFDVITGGRVSREIPATRLADLIQHQLLYRLFKGAP